MPKRKLTADAVRLIRSSSEPIAVLSRLFGVDRRTIRDARRGVTWARGRGDA